MQHTSTHPIPPAVLVIFGITGDLAYRKLLPALYHLAQDDALPPGFAIIGVTRGQTTVPQLLHIIKTKIQAAGEQADESMLAWLGPILSIVSLDITKTADYATLGTALDAHEDKLGVCLNRLFYLAIPAQMFASVARHLGQSGLSKGCSRHNGESRLLIEKPFGYDLESAQALISQLGEQFSEQRMYRVDHYLAKETAQNILTFRFNNPLFEAVWNRHAVDSIVITAAEKIGIEGRAAFYEQTGALRDFVQSHLLQLLALVTMEEPTAQTPPAIHAAKLALLQAINPIAPDKVATDTVRGQYQSYVQEVDDRHSFTETFAAVRLHIDNERWRGVPVLVFTGKQLAAKATEIILIFKDKAGNKTARNALTIRIQPDEGIVLELLAKKPGFDNQTQKVLMDFCYSRSFDGPHPDAYERVLIDALRGDKTLFATSDEVLRSWQIVESVVHAWTFSGEGLEHYTKGSWGPAGAAKLANDSGVEWRGLA